MGSPPSSLECMKDFGLASGRVPLGPWPIRSLSERRSSSVTCPSAAPCFKDRGRPFAGFSRKLA